MSHTKAKSEEDNLDIAVHAAEVLEENKKEAKKKHIPSVKRVLKAYHKKRAKDQAEFVWRQQVAKVWPKQKP